MPFFRGLVFYAAVAGSIYLGLKVECPPELAGALVPLLFLILTVDVPHFITLGTIDLRTSFYALMTRGLLSAPDTYTTRVLPWDVDDSGLIKPDRVVRALNYAVRKLWLTTGFEKDLASAGFELEVVQHTVKWLPGASLGVLSGYRVRSQVVCISDAMDSFFLEQKFIAGNNQHLLMSYTEFKLKDWNELRLLKQSKGLAERPALSKIIAHAVTRKLGGSKKRSKPKQGDKKAIALQAALTDVAGLCLDSRISDKPSLAKFVAYCSENGNSTSSSDNSNQASSRTNVPITEDDDEDDDDEDGAGEETKKATSGSRDSKAKRGGAKDPERMAEALESFVRDLKISKQQQQGSEGTKKDN